MVDFYVKCYEKCMEVMNGRETSRSSKATVRGCSLSRYYSHNHKRKITESGGGADGN